MTNLGGTGVSENTDFDDEITELLARQDRLNPATLAIWQADTSAQAGDVVTTKERTAGFGGGGTGDVIASGTETGFKIVKHNTLPLSWELREEPNIVIAAKRGMIADGDVGAGTGTDNSAVWQGCVDDQPNNGGLIALPNGQIKIDTPIDYGVGTGNLKRIKTIGKYGTNGTLVFAGAAMTSMIRLPQTIATANNVAGGEFVNIDFDAKSLADHCIDGFGNHMLFRDCRFRTSLISGTNIGFGWDNMFDHCYWLNNILDGFTPNSGQNNQNTFVGCKFVSNGGFGVVGGASFAMSFDNTLFENNAKAAFIGFGILGLSFSDSCYFDRNAQGVGVQFTTPSVLVKADIILNGSVSQDTMAVAAPCVGINIDTPFVSGNAVGPHTHVYAISSEDLVINNAALNSGDISDLVTTFGSLTNSSGFSRNKGLKINGSKSFDNRFVVENSTTAFAGQPDMVFDTVDEVNIAEDDLNAFTLISANTGGDFQRSTELHDLGKNIPVWEMDLAATTTSDRYGFSIDAADYPGLHGKPVMIAFDVKAAAANTPTITLTAKGATRTTSSTNWFELNMIFNMPVSGTVSFDVSKTGATGKAFFASPRLAEVGVDTGRIHRRIPLVGAVFMQGAGGDLPPTTGTWDRTDTVRDRTVSAGGSTGEMCVTSGTPGTWRSLPNLSA